MNKKILVVFSLILIGFTFGQLTNVSPEEMKEAIDKIKEIGVGIQSVGFIEWIKSNWFFFIATLLLIARIIIKITKSKKDDIWFGKHIMKPWNFFKKVIGF